MLMKGEGWVLFNLVRAAASVFESGFSGFIGLTIRSPV